MIGIYIVPFWDQFPHIVRLKVLDSYYSLGIRIKMRLSTDSWYLRISLLVELVQLILSGDCIGIVDAQADF